MNCFLDAAQRRASSSTCYFEFQKGKFREACWLPDSTCLKDDLWDEYRAPRKIWLRI